jgi:hypothetical protein
VLTTRDPRRTSPATPTRPNDSALSRRKATTERQTPSVGGSLTRQIVLSDVKSSEKTPLAPKISVTMPTTAPIPRAVRCACMLASVSSSSDRTAGEPVAPVSESINALRVAAPSPSANPTTVTRRRRSGKREKIA